MKKVTIRASKEYDVLIGYGLLPGLGRAIAERHAPCRVALVSDDNVFSLYGKAAIESLAAAGFSIVPCTILPGESSKSCNTMGALLERFAEYGLTRSDIVVALGGGVTGDIAGMAASIYMRGIDYVQVPTTLLAAVDSSVGGKTGFNLPQGKNLVGSFWQPILVLCDCDTFSTLPREVFLDGVAESLKYGVIADQSLFQRIAQGALDHDCIETVARCVQIKASMVGEDERDLGRRQLLNLGHTLGHAIEKMSGYDVSHGHAVAIGIVGAARIAEALNECVMGTAGIIMAMHDRLGLPSETSYDAEALAHIAMSDKKRTGSKMNLILPKSIGQCVCYPVEIKEIPRLFRLAKGERL